MGIDFNYYKTVSNNRGATKNQVLSEMQEQFDYTYENNHITYFEALIDTKRAEKALVNFEKEIRCIIYDEQLKEMVLNANNRKLLCDTKAVKTGDYVTVKMKHDETTERTYIVRNLVDRLRGYDKSNILFCQQKLKFMTANRKIVSYPMHVLETKSLLKDDGQLYLSTSYSFFSVIMQDNEHTREIKDGQRFIIKNRAYRVTGFDDLSMDGTITVRFETDEKTINDNLELGIADYYKNTPTIPTPPLVKQEILGENTLIVGEEQEYRAIMIEPVTDCSWSVSAPNGDDIDYVEMQINNDVVVLMCDNKRRVGSSFVLTGIANGVTLTKIITISREY